MPRVVVDSDDEDADVLSQYERAESEHTQRDAAADKLQDDRTQSTGSTERMLRQAHALMARSVTPDVGRQSMNASIWTDSCKRPLSEMLPRAEAGQSHYESTSAKRRRTEESRQDEWDVPFSSPSKHDLLKPKKGRTEAMVIITEPGSTVMDSTSSDERRTREVREASGAVNDDVDAPVSQGDQTRQGGLRTDVDYRDDNDACIVLEQSPTHESTGPHERNAQSRQKKAKKRSAAEAVAQDNDLDELSIGLPKEHYQPRPSRSRSHQLTSRDPGQIEMQRQSEQVPLKRRKTLDILRDEDREALTEMGFNSSQAVEALRETDGNVQRATDWLLSGGDMESKQSRESKEQNTASCRVEAPEQKERQRARGRPRKAPVMPEDTENPSANFDESMQVRDNDEGAAPHILKADEETREQNSLQATKSIIGGKERSRKRGRGRPPKQSDTVTDHVRSPEVPTDVGESTGDKIDAHGVDAGTPHTEADGPNAPSRIDQVPPDPSLTGLDADKSEKPNDAPHGSVSAEVAEPSPKDTKRDKCTTSPSTMSVKAGKVPLRVGLSKRMRIPSLLSSARKPAMAPTTGNIQTKPKGSKKQA